MLKFINTLTIHKAYRNWNFSNLLLFWIKNEYFIISCVGLNKVLTYQFSSEVSVNLITHPPYRTNQNPTALSMSTHRYALACMFPGEFRGYVPAVLRYCLIGHQTNRQTDGKRSIVNFCTPMPCRTQKPNEGRPLAEMSCSIQLSSLLFAVVLEKTGQCHKVKWKFSNVL